MRHRYTIFRRKGQSAHLVEGDGAGREMRRLFAGVVVSDVANLSPALSLPNHGAGRRSGAGQQRAIRRICTIVQLPSVVVIECLNKLSGPGIPHKQGTVFAAREAGPLRSAADDKSAVARDCYCEDQYSIIPVGRHIHGPPQFASLGVP